MKHCTIIWDFDGTLLPNDPYDSEQTLMLHKLNGAGPKLPFWIHALARGLLYADQREHLRRVFKKFYIRFMRGSHVSDLDLVCGRLADKISAADRSTLRHLANQGHPMIVLSCGTADLSAGTLKKAGLGDCFERIAANRFVVESGRINGMTLHVPNPEDKVKYLVAQRIDPARCVAVGDGYTDIPLLDWAKISVMVDRTGQKQAKYGHKNYHFVRSLSEILDIIYGLQPLNPEPGTDTAL